MNRGRTAYHAYGERTSWKAYTGSPMPSWEALPEGVRRAWDSAATAIALPLLNKVNAWQATTLVVGTLWLATLYLLGERL